MEGCAEQAGNDRWRRLYRSALHPEGFWGDETLNSLVEQSEPVELSELERQIDHWKAREAEIYAHAAAVAADRHKTHAFAQAMAVYSAPMASVLGCWLQGMSAPGVFEDSGQLQIMQLFAHDVGIGYPEASRAHHFKALLGQLQLPSYALAPAQLSTLPQLSDEAFELPAILQALSRRSDLFGDELCGIDWALRCVGLCPGWTTMGELQGLALDLRRLDLREPFNTLEATSLRQISNDIARQIVAQSEIRRDRLLRGASWLFAALKRWNARLYNASCAAISPNKAMAELIQRLAPVGAVYHQNFFIQGRSLAKWLEGAKTDPLPFLEALSHSHLIVPGNSKKSKLVTNLVTPSGPMFRIFSETDLLVIRDWIDCLPLVQDGLKLQERQVTPPTTTSDVVSDNTLGRQPQSLREAYHVLQGRALDPATRRFANDYVTRWLARSRRSLKTSEHQLPRGWDINVLRNWLLDKHEQNGKRFDNSDPTQAPSREEIVESTLQLAPLTLIDGAWLQGFTDLYLASSHVGFALFQTYWDELGNGTYTLNHPKIYRDVLRQMNIELAPTGSREFAEDPRFHEGSLRLPVYWLCLGKFPETFMPEILGMNLAMELSGVGGSYRSARRFLKQYGFSTTFVDLHNTIDNVATGHSAWAADAIDAYMRSLSPKAIAAQWKRIRIGYESLAPVTGKWRSMFKRLGLKSVVHRFPHAESEGEPQHYLHHLPITRNVLTEQNH